MSADGSKALRRAIAELAGLESVDLRAILEQLDGAERARAEALLREFAALDPEPHTALAQSLKGAPDWLCARILAGLSVDERKQTLAGRPAHERQRLLSMSDTVRITPCAARALQAALTASKVSVSVASNH